MLPSTPSLLINYLSFNSYYMRILYFSNVIDCPVCFIVIFYSTRMSIVTQHALVMTFIVSRPNLHLVLKFPAYNILSYGILFHHISRPFLDIIFKKKVKQFLYSNALWSFPLLFFFLSRFLFFLFLSFSFSLFCSYSFSATFMLFFILACNFLCEATSSLGQYLVSLVAVSTTQFI